MKKPEVILQKLEIKRARGQGFGWGLWIGFAAGIGLMLLLERWP